MIFNEDAVQKPIRLDDQSSNLFRTRVTTRFLLSYSTSSNNRVEWWWGICRPVQVTMVNFLPRTQLAVLVSLS